MAKKNLAGRRSSCRSAVRSGVMLASAAAGVLAFDSAGFAQTMSPINTSGWNENNIFNTTGSRIGAFDSNNGWSLYTTNAPNIPGGGLPASGTITSAANSNTTFQLQSYSSNTALHLNNYPYTSYNDYATSGTISFTAPAKYSSLAFLSADANGNTPVSYTINFAGGAAPLNGSFEGQDWYNGTNVAISNIGRVQSFTVNYPSFETPKYDYTGASPELYEDDIAIPANDQQYRINSISFSIASSGSTQFNLYAISGSQFIQTPYIYTGAVSTVIDSSTANFSFNGSTATFVNGNPIQFDDSVGPGNYVLSIASGGVSPNDTIFNNSSATYTINGPGGFNTGTLEMNGGGTVTLNNSNTYTGGTSVSAGTLILGSNGSLATNEIDVSSGATFTVNSGGTLTSTSLVLNDAGTVNFNGPALSVATLSGSGALNLHGTALTVTQGGNFTGTISETASSKVVVNVPAGNTFTLSGNNSYSGGTALESGLLQVGSNGALGSGAITFQGGSIGATAGSNPTITNAFVVSQSTGLTFDAANAATFTGGGNVTLPAGTTPLVVTTHDSTSSRLQLAANFVNPAGGSAALNISGDFAMTGNSTYSGGTTLNDATDVATNTAGAFGTGVINFNNGGIGTLSGATGLVIPNAFQFGSTPAGYFENYNSFTMSGPGFLGTGATFNPATNTFSGGGGPGAQINVYVPVVTFSGSISGGGLELANGSNVLELSGSNTFSGPIQIDASSPGNQAGTLQVDNPASLGATTIVSVGSGGSFETNSTATNMGLGVTVQLTGSGATVSNGTASGTSGALRGGDNQASVWAGNVSVSGASTFSSGASTSGPASLTLTGSITGDGPVIFTSSPLDTTSGATIIVAPSLGNTNTYTGETQLVGGISAAGTTTLKLGANNALSTASGLNIIAGTAPTVNFDMGGYNQSIQYLTGSAQAGLAIVNSGTRQSVLTISNGNSGTGPASSGVAITGNIAVAKTGSGNQSLTGSSTYTGGTNISAGTLTAGSSKALGTGPVTLNGGTLNLTYPAGGLLPVINGLSSSAFTSNGSFAVSGSSLTLTNGGGQITSAWTNNPVSFNNGFVVKFAYSVTSTYALTGIPSSPADGMTFTLQNAGPNAIGGGGGQLGYAGIQNSAALATDIYLNGSNGPGTAFISGGSNPQNANFNLPGDPNNPDYDYYDTEYASGATVFDYTITYSPTAQVMTLQVQSPSGTYTSNYSTGDISSLVGGNTAYIGFTGAAGGNYALATVSDFSYSIFASGPTSIANNVIAAPSTSSVIQLSVASGFQAGAIGSLNIGSGALVKLASVSADGVATHGVLSTTGLTLSGSAGHWTGTLDLTNNALDVQNGSPAVLATITNQAKQGYAGGTWQGSGGITSSTAAADSRHLTAVGVILNDTNQAGGGTALYGQGGGIASTFDGATPSLDDVLVKYTYYGDVNLDGAVDGSDYAVVDNSFETEKSAGTHINGWGNGDFNYDGVVDGSDYTLMDNAFNQQGGSLGVNPAAQLANPTTLVAGGSAVPEPATFSLLGMGAIGLLGRRRRKNEVMA